MGLLCVADRIVVPSQWDVVQPMGLLCRANVIVVIVCRANVIAMSSQWDGNVQPMGSLSPSGCLRVQFVSKSVFRTRCRAVAHVGTHRTSGTAIPIVSPLL